MITLNMWNKLINKVNKRYFLAASARRDIIIVDCCYCCCISSCISSCGCCCCIIICWCIASFLFPLSCSSFFLILSSSLCNSLWFSISFRLNFIFTARCLLLLHLSLSGNSLCQSLWLVSFSVAFHSPSFFWVSLKVSRDCLVISSTLVTSSSALFFFSSDSL